MRYIKNYKLRIACLRCCIPSSVQSFFPYFFSPSSISRWCLDVYSNTEKHVNISQLAFSCEKSYFNSSTPLTGVSADPQRISLSKSATEVMCKSWRWRRLVVRAKVKVGQSVSEPYNFWALHSQWQKEIKLYQEPPFSSSCISGGRKTFALPAYVEESWLFLSSATCLGLQSEGLKLQGWNIDNIHIHILAANLYLCRC